MSRRRSRNRTREGPQWRIPVIVLVATVLVLSSIGPPTIAVETGTVDRPASIGVVSDLNGAQSLNVTGELEEGSENCLVEVTNHLGQSVTVTVSLRDDSTEHGTLTVSLPDQTKSGDTVQFDLVDGDTQTVKMEVDAGTASNATYFHVTASGSGVHAETKNRSASIVSSADTTCA